MGYLIAFFAGVSMGWCAAALVVRGSAPQCADCEWERHGATPFIEERAERAAS